jgi:alpha-amylase/alpha-mannosidase (GH57 family)
VKWIVVVLCLAGWGVAALGAAEKTPLNLAIVWHQHQPLYWNRLTAEYELPWARVHAVQEYIDSARISAEFPGVRVAFNLQPSLLWQLEDYATISADETAKGGLYEIVGAVDNHLRWTWTLAHDPSALAAEDRTRLQEQAFWINGYMFTDTADDPYYDVRYAELNALRSTRSLTDQELLDAAALFLLWQISPELHEELGLLGYRAHSGFAWDDIAVILSAQMTVIRRVVAAYRDIARWGNELFTSPFYHPILPILAARGWGADVLGQLEQAQTQHEALFDRRALGVWSPEQAVSDDSLALLAQAGFNWTTTDEGLLAQALGHTPTPVELTRVYESQGMHVLFRESELSNRISFAYGNKGTAAAVADFLGELRKVYDQVDDPSQHVLTVALDGENWMFMAGYPNNGRDFLRALYSALSTASWVRTVTPSEVLPTILAHTTLEHVPTGSWAGDLSTWAGEPEEDQAWEELAAARAVVSAAGDPPAALDAIYAAEGSDWFWWYGTDQDSNTDDLFDWLFKAHVVGAYEAAGVPAADIPAVLSLRLVLPTPASLGEVAPTLDGTASPEDGWGNAATIPGNGEIVSLSVGYKETNLYVLVETATDPTTWIGQEVYVTLYASGQPGAAANVATRTTGTTLGFPLASAVQVNFAKLNAQGVGVASKYAADGRGGWTYASTIRTNADRKAAVAQRIEFSVPFSELGVEPGKTVTLTVVLERPGSLIGQAPLRPMLAAIPTLIRGIERFSVSDPQGDDHGTGTYAYPLNSVFATPGLFDLVQYSVYDAGTAWQMAFDFAALPNPWNGPLGFSHPILYLYFDVADGGATASHPEGEAAQVAFDPTHPWDFFVRVAGWPAYGRHAWTASGEGPFLIEVASDPKRGRIIVTVPKTLLPEVEGWHYILVGSQDGYGKNYLRSIGATPGEWSGGGSPDPFWAPVIYDVLAPAGTTQEAMLALFDAAAGSYATLIPLHVKFDSP